MSKKLFVGNLPFDVNDADLATVLAVAGTVESAKVVVNNKTGRSKGYGFVEMATEEMAKDAVAKFEGATLNERTITVQIASPTPKPEGKEHKGPRRNHGPRKTEAPTAPVAMTEATAEASSAQSAES